jgi:hypothetical protein
MFGSEYVDLICAILQQCKPVYKFISIALQLKFVYVNPFAKFKANFLFAAGL